jgi:hypothetical protein
LASTVALAAFAGSLHEAHAADKDCMVAASSGQQARDEGRLMEARARFQVCAQTECPAPIPAYCRDWLADVARKLPTLVLRAVDSDNHDLPDANVVVDERPVTVDGRAIEIDPGRHRVRMSGPGMQPFETEFVAAQGEQDRVLVGRLVPASRPVLPRPPPRLEHTAPPRSIPTASKLAWGVGALGLVSFSIFGTKARLDYDDYRASCGERCAASARDSVATSVTIADVSLVVALAAAGVGTFFFLTHSTGRPAGRLAR